MFMVFINFYICFANQVYLHDMAYSDKQSAHLHKSKGLCIVLVELTSQFYTFFVMRGHWHLLDPQLPLFCYIARTHDASG